MTDDEAAIRDLIAAWIAASKSGDTEAVLSLIPAMRCSTFLAPSRLEKRR